MAGIIPTAVPPYARGETWAGLTISRRPAGSPVRAGRDSLTFFSGFDRFRFPRTRGERHPLSSPGSRARMSPFRMRVPPAGPRDRETRRPPSLLPSRAARGERPGGCTPHRGEEDIVFGSSLRPKVRS